eukprot:15477210-Alexandrium_andersonii.AAC.1
MPCAQAASAGRAARQRSQWVVAASRRTRASRVPQPLSSRAGAPGRSWRAQFCAGGACALAPVIRQLRAAGASVTAG